MRDERDHECPLAALENVSIRPGFERAKKQERNRAEKKRQMSPS